MRKLLISFIIPVFNGEKYIRNAIDSVLCQINEEVEIVIVDDGSTDSTGRIIDEYAAENECIKVIHQQNQWMYASINNGVKIASGEYIYVLNSDDSIIDGSISIALRKMHEYDYPDIIWTKMEEHLCDSELNIKKVYTYPGLADIKEKYYPSSQSVRTSWPAIWDSSLSFNQANFYKRKFYLNHPLRNDIHTADTLFNLYIASDVESALIMQEPVYIFNVFEDNRNTSIGKYYGYEHYSNGEIYRMFVKNYTEWGIDAKHRVMELSLKHMRGITHEIRILGKENCFLTTDEKIKKIMVEYTDEIMMSAVSICDKREEFEARILSGIRELFSREALEPTSEMYFVYRFMESLLRYEKTAEDFEILESSINNPLNPQRIGETFAAQLDRKNVF